MNDTDFTRWIVDAFVDRRGRGTTVSSADQQLLWEWEQRGLTIDIVWRGVEDAFARKREAPASLRACRRWVEARWKEHQTAPSAAVEAEAAGPSGALRASGLLPSASDVPEPSPARTTPSLATISPTLAATLGTWCREHARDEVRAEVELLVRELEADAEAGTLDAFALAQVPARLAERLHARLEPEERSAMDASLQASPLVRMAATAVARQRTLARLRVEETLRRWDLASERLTTG